MVLQKRLDYGFNGYQVPPVPRAARSVRRRCIFKKKVNNNQMCAFDVLATVAGKLLLEGESSPSLDNALSSPSLDNVLTGKDRYEIARGSVKKEEHDEVTLKGLENCAHKSGDRGLIISEPISQAPILSHSSKESRNSKNDACSRPASVITTSDWSDKFVCAEPVNYKSEVGVGTFGNKVKTGSVYNESIKEDDTKKIIIEPPKLGKVAVSARASMCSSDNQVFRERKPTSLVSLDDSVNLSLYRNPIPHCSLPTGGDDVKLVNRDDDENSSGFSQPTICTKASRPPPRIGDRRIRKLLASKYWQVTPRSKDEKSCNNDSEMKSIHRNRKYSYKRQRSQRDYPFKKRKFYACNSISNSDEGISFEGMTCSLGHDLSGDVFASGLTNSEASGMSAPVAAQHTSLQPKDSHVKLRIKSFKVPELFIEIPETDTVGSLKRTVMEAVTAILGSGLRVGVLFKGKKVRDDGKTLQQSGISLDNQMDALGFTLEPNSSHTSHRLCPEDRPFLLPCDAPQSLTRYQPAPNVVQQGSSDASRDRPATNMGNLVESDHDSAPSPPDKSVDKNTSGSQALVAVPATNVDSLSLVPTCKSKRCEVGQRRIRRPFSVSEVEALVQAVEKLGTGRWRDVKLRAFDNAKHRTYVDLKDKWKTLVHTAKISAQQRRGEPVPQELLDRVLTAHAYWSQHQEAKQQLKQSESPRYLL